ncbi:MAG: arylsulfatase, partial [Akkermansiaceae bacterium]
RAIQVGDWKLVQTNLALPDKSTTELFDLSKDISEITDLAKRYPKKTAELLKLIKTARIPNTEFPVPVLETP